MNDHAPALCSEAVCAACDAYGAGCSRGKDATRRLCLSWLASGTR